MRGQSVFLLTAFFAFFALAGGPAQAGSVDVSQVARNISTSAQDLPGLITAIAYLLAILFGVLGVLKLKEHVENPSQTPLRVPIIRFIIGGALLALPMISEAMRNAINAGNASKLDLSGDITTSVSSFLGTFTGLPILTNVNFILKTILESIQDIPGLVTIAGYLLGLLLGILGLLKIRDHVENPDQTKLKEGVIRLLIGGAFFALPTVFEAMRITISDGNPLTITSFISAFSFVISSQFLQTCTPGMDMGGVICNALFQSGGAIGFLAAISYAIGLVLGFWALVKIKDHVENPGQTRLHEPITRLIAAGLFFTLPYVVDVIHNTITPATVLPHNTTAFNDGLGVSSLCARFGIGCATGPLDLGTALRAFATSVSGPITTILNFFGFVAGMILIMIAIMRLTKSAQEGARGPAGLGTFMTFVAGGALISFNQLMSAASMTFFGSPITRTYATLQYTTGMLPGEIAHANMIIAAILKFMIVVGLISFVRGIFIIRDVAEGKQQASIMAGATHMIGGALAVNLGPLLAAVQSTLGITAYGITFT